MNKKAVIYIASALALCLLMFGAVKLYNHLSKEYSFTENFINQDSEKETNVDEAKKEDVTDAETDAQSDEQEKDDNNKAPDFEVFDKSGNEVTLSSKLGKPVVLNFWATWCGPCKSELPAFNELYGKYKDKVDFMMINLTDGESQTREIVDSFVEENGYEFPVYYDETLAASYMYGASSIPLTVIVYPDGTLYGGRYGAMSKQELEYYIKDILEE